jgi:hypothetical protein
MEGNTETGEEQTALPKKERIQRTIQHTDTDKCEESKDKQFRLEGSTYERNDSDAHERDTHSLCY